MKKITQDSLDQAGAGNNILEDLLDQQVREIETILGEHYRGMGNKILSMFVQNGNRIQLSESDIAEDLKRKKGLNLMMAQRVLDQMTQANLLRKTLGGKFELSNNLLAQRAFQKVEAENRVLRTMRSTIRDRMVRKELLDEHYLNYVTASLDLLELSPEESGFVEASRDNIQRTKRRRSFLLTAFTTVLAVLTLWASMQTCQVQRYAKDVEGKNALLRQKSDSLRDANIETNNYAKQTLEAYNVAIKERARADSLKVVAEANAELAREEAARANENAKKAQAEKANAEREADKALQASAAARRAEEAAVLAAERAEKLRIDAEKAEDEAEKARQRAVVFSNAVVALNAALKSQELDDAHLQALVAHQAYNIVSSTPELGLTSHPYIYNALYYAVKNVDEDIRFRNKAHNGSVRDIVFQPDGRRFFTTGSDGIVRQWDIEEWNALGVPAHRLYTLPLSGDAVHNALALSLDGNQLLVGGELGFIQQYNLSNKLVRRIDWPKGKSDEEIYSLGYLNNLGAMVAMGRSHLYFFDGSNAQFQVLPKLPSRASTFLNTSRGTIPLNVQVAYQELTKFNIEGLVNGRLFRQEFGTREINAQSNYGSLISLAAHEVGGGEARLALGFQNGQIVLGRMAIATLEVKSKPVSLFKQNQSPIVDIAFSASGNYLAVASLDGRVTIWDLKNSENDPTYQPLILDDHDTWATSVAFTPDERFLLVGTKKGEVAFWNLDPRVFADHLCTQLRLKYLSPRYDEMDNEDWKRFFGKDIKQQRVCGGN